MRWVVFAIALGLAGCAGSVAERMISPEKVASREDEYCRSLGAEPGSSRYQDCRMTLLGHAEGRRAQAMDSLSRSADNLSNPVRQPNPTVNCTTTGPYAVRSTTCN
jgi:hypothetical protein